MNNNRFSISLLLSLCFFIIMICRISSTSVDIQNSSKKLSTDIIYAIWNPYTNNYLMAYKDYIKTHELWGSIDSIAAGEEGSVESQLQWQLELQQSGRYALSTRKYPGWYLYFPASWDDGFHLVSSPSAWSRDDLGYEFKMVLPEQQDYENSPTIQIWGEHDEPFYIYDSGEPGDYMSINYESNPSESRERHGKWVFVPLTLPLSCENIEYDTPEELKLLTTQIDTFHSVSYTNTNFEEMTYTTDSKEICNDVTTTWSRTDSSELTFGFTIGFETESTSGSSITTLSADYNMQWTYYSEETNEHSESTQVCTTVQQEIVCPARTICYRQATAFKPPVDKYDVTVNATCDGVTYTSQGTISVSGFVYTEVLDSLEPLDCEYYTTNSTELGKEGKLPFCDNCEDDQECKICRDTKILLDGVCITEQVCENVCGGVTQGDGAWSGGWCEIEDETKYNSTECKQDLGKI